MDSFDSWLVDSGASRHFTGYPKVLSNLFERESNLKIILGDNATCPIKGTGFVSFHLDFDQTIHLEEVLNVSGLKKNLVSISTLEDKGFKVAFINGKVRAWPRGSSLKDVFAWGSRIEGLYKVNRRPIQALVHDSNHQCELWHRRFTHLHYRALPNVRNMVFGMPKIRLDHDGVCQGCASGKHVKGPFPSSRSEINGILQLIHFDLCGPMPVTSLGRYLLYSLCR